MDLILRISLSLMTLLPLSLVGCGSGGSGSVGNSSGVGGPFGETPVAVTGNVDSMGGAQGAPDRLAAPISGYLVRAADATTGETLPGAVATTDANGNVVIVFSVSLTSDTSIVLVAQDPQDSSGATVMRSILPLVVSDFQILVNQGRTTLTAGVISPSSEQAVQKVEQSLGLALGTLGQIPIAMTASQINGEAMKDNLFVLVGITLTIQGQVTGDISSFITPPPSVLNVDLANLAGASPNSEVCEPCHGVGGRYNRNQLWKESGHGNYELALLVATDYVPKGYGNDCGRCHTGQGFLSWLDQAQSGEPGLIIDNMTNKDATSDYMVNLGLPPNTVVPQTCSTCHFPHSGSNPAQLRVYNNTPMLPAGFRAGGVGKGALCMTCHNTSGGVQRVYSADNSVIRDKTYLHEDSDPIGNDPVKGVPDYAAPHSPSQADVFMGHNAYFMSGTNISMHAAIDDTCVQCHMTLVPAYVDPTTQEKSGTNHKFRVTQEQICSKCHGDAVSGAPLQGEVQNLLDKLADLLSQYLMSKMQRLASDSNNVKWINIQGYPITDPATGTILDSLTPATDIDSANIDHVLPWKTHGQQGFVFVFKNPVTFAYSDSAVKAVDEIEVPLGNIKHYLDPINKPNNPVTVIPLTDLLIKAGWNYFLFRSDGTLGIHNPSFYLKALDATITAMQSGM